ncbi:MAG: hypothetical protein GY862_22530 [Gammaproteobacteria bacterium]|nr:hypothetical protein [Gammaproteobacteria bacterium]
MRQFSDWIIPDAAVWSDRFAWAPVRQIKRRTAGGGLVVWAQKLRGGRPVTLEFQPHRVLLEYADVIKLLEMAAVPGQTFVLVWDEVELVVMFNREDSNQMEFTPVFGLNNSSDDKYAGRINLISIGGML